MTTTHKFPPQVDAVTDEVVEQAGRVDALLNPTVPLLLAWPKIPALGRPEFVALNVKLSKLQTDVRNVSAPYQTPGMEIFEL